MSEASSTRLGIDRRPAGGFRARRGRAATRLIALVLGLLTLALFLATFGLGPMVDQPAVGNVWGAPFAVVGCVIAYRQPRNAIGWLLLATSIVTIGCTDAGWYALLKYRFGHQGLPLGRAAVGVAGFWTLFLVLLPLPILLFPDGQLPSGRWRVTVWAYGALAAVLISHTLIASRGLLTDRSLRLDNTGELSTLGGGGAGFGLAYMLVVLSWVACKVSTYRSSNSERRAQLKWLMSGGVVTIVGFAVGLALNKSSSSVVQLTAALGFMCAFALPVSIGVGILRYHLYDIDRLVSRTLSYAILSTLLVGVFVGLVALTTDLLPFSSSVGVAASTLAAAALFNPLRRRVQRLVDRRFNRSRYDAEAMVAAFASRLRDAIDLDSVQSEFLEVVKRAVEPAHATVWVRPHDAPTRAAAPR